MLSILRKSRVLILTLLLSLAMASFNRADQDKEAPQNKNAKKKLSVINSISDITLQKDNLPEDWNLLNKRVVRDEHDRNLLVTIDIAMSSLGVKISAYDCQPFLIGKEQFNVDIFWVEEGMDTLKELLAGWLSPGNDKSTGEPDINWLEVSYEKALLVISTSDLQLQDSVENEYTRLWFSLIEKEADKALKDKKDDIALQYFNLIFPALEDVGRGYMNLAGIYLHMLKDPALAFAYYEKALSFSKQSNFTDMELWGMHAGIGLSGAFSGDMKKAEKGFLKSYEIAQKMKNDEIIADAAYNLACVYAENKDKEKVYEYLETSFKLDNKKAKVAPKDPSFKDFQNESRFKDLLKKYGS